MNTLRPWLRPQIGLGLVFLLLAFTTDKVAFFLLGIVFLGAGLQARATFHERAESGSGNEAEPEPEGMVFDIRL